MDLEGAKDMLAHDRVAQGFGMEILDFGPGRASVGIELGDRHLNAMDSAQGGAIFALADMAFALAINSHGPAVAANCSINFIKGAKSGRLVATAREMSLGNRLASYQVEVRDQDGALVASVQALGYRLSQK